ncbi:MAG TPA: LPS export ABC transporter periplasmic protein LptC [Geminicoccaceae bacterium]|nr:LPS export ABC transporter periplasmic protein LptC [Geminicoccaceae bacterium]HZA66560.1 LPS export ABC transporter periplasmic protein LptC [Geminicoccaceae bacterium]
MSSALRGLAPRAGATAPDRWLSRRTVGVLRLALPIAALLLVGLVMAWPQLVGRGAGLIAPMLVPDEIAGGDVMRMHQPRYVGQTENAEPFELTAASAYLDPIRPDRVHLDQLAGDLDSSGRRDFRIVAVSGIYDRNKEKLELSGGIELTTSDGYRFETPSASVDLDRARVVGREPIAGAGPNGTLAAERFEFEDGGEILRFNGRVRVTLQASSDVRS